ELHFVSSFGRKLTDHYFVTEDTNESFSLECGENPYVVEDVDTLSEIYEELLESAVSDTGIESPIIQPISQFGHEGRQLEFSRLKGSVFVRVWIFVIGENRYQMQFIARKPWLSPVLSSSQERMMAEFMSSFSLIQPRAAVNKKFAESLPQTLLGTVKNEEYINSFFNFQMRPPKRWLSLSNEQLVLLFREKG